MRRAIAVGAVAILAAALLAQAVPAQQNRAPVGTFPPWEISCADSMGVQVYHQNLREYPTNDSLDGYIRLHLWQGRGTPSINHTNCEITDNRTLYR